LGDEFTAPASFCLRAQSAVRSSPMNEEVTARTPAKRWGKAEELFGGTIFLPSCAADFIADAMLPVDKVHSVYYSVY
jgi:2-dehydro-3-deoxy-D-gluconate 5-dehydrogenase